MEIVDKVIPEHGFSNGELLAQVKKELQEELRFYKPCLSKIFWSNIPTFSVNIKKLGFAMAIWCDDFHAHPCMGETGDSPEPSTF